MNSESRCGGSREAMGEGLDSIELAGMKGHGFESGEKADGEFVDGAWKRAEIRNGDGNGAGLVLCNEGPLLPSPVEKSSTACRGTIPCQSCRSAAGRSSDRLGTGEVRMESAAGETRLRLPRRIGYGQHRG